MGTDSFCLCIAIYTYLTTNEISSHLVHLKENEIHSISGFIYLFLNPGKLRLRHNVFGPTSKVSGNDCYLIEDHLGP